MAELSLTKKVFIVGATWFSLFFTGGTIFGYSALKQSLLENEVLFLLNFTFLFFFSEYVKKNYLFDSCAFNYNHCFIIELIRYIVISVQKILLLIK